MKAKRAGHSPEIMPQQKRKAPLRPPIIFKPAFSKIRPTKGSDKLRPKHPNSFDTSVTMKDKTPRLFATASSVIAQNRSLEDFSHILLSRNKSRTLKSFESERACLPNISNIFRVKGVLHQLSKSVMEEERKRDMLSEEAASLSFTLSSDGQHYKTLIRNSRKNLMDLWPSDFAAQPVNSQMSPKDGTTTKKTNTQQQMTTTGGGSGRLKGFKMVPNLPQSSATLSIKLPKLLCQPMRLANVKRAATDEEVDRWTHVFDRRAEEFELKSEIFGDLLGHKTEDLGVSADEEELRRNEKSRVLPQIQVTPPVGTQNTANLARANSDFNYPQTGTRTSHNNSNINQSHSDGSLSASGSSTKSKLKVINGIVYESYKIPGSDKEHFGIKGFLSRGQEVSNILKSVGSSYDTSDFVEIDRIEADGMQKDLAEADRMALVNFRNHEKYPEIKKQLKGLQRLDSLSKTGLAGSLKKSEIEMHGAPPLTKSELRESKSQTKSSKKSPNKNSTASMSKEDMPVYSLQEKMLQWVIANERRKKELQTKNEPQTVNSAVERCETLAEYRTKFQEIKKNFRSKNEQKAARDSELIEIEKDRERTMRNKKWKLILDSSLSGRRPALAVRLKPPQ